MGSLKTDGKKKRINVLEKAPTGVSGFDEITGGGLPRGRPTLICGGPGCGKTLFGMEFLVRGASEFNEPGVFISFEEKEDDLIKNVKSLNLDVEKLIDRKKLVFDYVRVERGEIEETGAYDLEGLFVRIDLALRETKAKRIVLDTIESLFSGLTDTSVLRAEIRRLFRWLSDKGITSIITGERGEGSLTRQGLEEYVSDCVIFVDHRVTGQVSTRRLRVVKYRGSQHGTNEYPFLIDKDGISVVPITSLALMHRASKERLSSGIEHLDEMLGGKGYFRGSSILISGTAGTGKSSVAAHFVSAACKRNETCLYFAFEESVDQIVRNMSSVGVDLQRWIKKGLLKIITSRPTGFGLEMHLAKMHKALNEHKPSVVIVDPITNLISDSNKEEVSLMLMRLIDFMKMESITALFTSLTHGGAPLESTEVGVSSLMDTWILLEDIQMRGERNRGLQILKSRGMKHSNQVREFILSEDGIKLLDVYLGASGLLTGTARVAQEAEELFSEEVRSRDFENKWRSLKRREITLKAQMESLREELQEEESELLNLKTDQEKRRQRKTEISSSLIKRRQPEKQTAGRRQQKGLR